MVDKDMSLNCQVITIDNMNSDVTLRTLSKRAYIKLCQSSKDVGNGFNPELFSATIAEQVPELMARFKLTWNYPWQGTETDLHTGLKKSAYPTTNKNNRIACALSHYRLWAQCVHSNEPMLIMEHDAYFMDRLKGYYAILDDNRWDIIGINEPRGNTRKAQVFHQKVYEAVDPEHSEASYVNDKIDIVPVPTIDSFDIPQGLAGNSAYIIKPNGAANLLLAVNKYGLWPNDAIMCKQLIPRMAVTKYHFTDTQKWIVSTTS
jgi:GR25 family glycosyltransferase involved in LPS biosynthesis